MHDLKSIPGYSPAVGTEIFADCRRARRLPIWMAPALMLAAACSTASVRANGYKNPYSVYYNEIGLPQLISIAPTINGSGVDVMQPEASQGWNYNVEGDEFEVNPASVNQPAANFSYLSYSGTNTTTFVSGLESNHADMVAGLFYGNNETYTYDNTHTGVAWGVSHIYSVDASVALNYYNGGPQYTPFILPYYYYPNGGEPAAPTSTPLIVNDSWVANPGTVSDGSYVQGLDQCAAKFNMLFINAIGNGTPNGPSKISPPATMYNGIAVADYNGTETNGVFSPASGAPATWVGPTPGGRSKPDITAPTPYTDTSFTTPIVSGVAALLTQAAMDNVGGTGTAGNATDMRAIKALLLNGAVKPQGWTNNYTRVLSGTGTSQTQTLTYLAPSNVTSTPLDPRYGAGVVNALNSYENLAGGEHNFNGSVSAAYTAGVALSFSFDSAAASYEPGPEGWNLASISNSSGTNVSQHYMFNLAGSVRTTYTLTATLAWNLDASATSINNLYLALVNSAGTVVGQSNSNIDNVQQLYLNGLTAGAYDLEVLKPGGTMVSNAETYALAYNFVAAPEPSCALLLTAALGLALLAPRYRRRIHTTSGHR